MKEKLYELVFEQGRYSSVDFVGTYEECAEMRYHLQADMYMCGERDFYYIIREKKGE